MNYLRQLLRKRAVVLQQPRSYRPVLESLEERWLLSGGFAEVILVSDVPGLASVTNPNMVNPWGISFSPTGPFWIAENGTGASDLFDGRGQPVPLVVTIPQGDQSPSSPTGTVFNAGSGFVISESGFSAPSRFLFANENGTIAGWSELVNPTNALLVIDNSASGAVYTGLALGTDSSGVDLLYTTDFSHGTVDVFNQEFRPVIRPGAFQDPNLPSGYAPFNIQNIANLLFVSYAKQSNDPADDMPGRGNGFIDVYQLDGSFVRRFTSEGALDSPWGLALAPASFGQFGGALLVGNNGDGLINAYDMKSGDFLGELRDTNNVPIAIPNLWALAFGNDHAGGNAETLFFAAGTDDDLHGFFGAIQAPGRVGTDTAGSGVFDPNGPGEPGDYPLPPTRGPETLFRPVNIPNVDLQPLKSSSLVLVPTLSGISPLVLSSDLSVRAGPTNSSSFAVTDLSGLHTPDAPIAVSPSAPFRVSGGFGFDAAPQLDVLDFDISSEGDKTREHADLWILFLSNWMTAERDAGTYRILNDSISGLASQSEKVQPQLPVQSDENLSLAVAENPATLGKDYSAQNAPECTKGIRWSDLMHFAFIMSFPILSGYWLRLHKSKIAITRK
jgi:uncharacterized protein (TIGR03118 family)